MSVDWMSDVLAFHEKFACVIGHTPAVPTEGTVELRAGLISEERRELDDAMCADDLPGIADAIADLIYVLLGTAISYGIDIRPVWDAVQAANMAKVGGATRGDGKILKPVGWTPPDVAGLLSAQGPLSRETRA